MNKTPTGPQMLQSVSGLRPRGRARHSCRPDAIVSDRAVFLPSVRSVFGRDSPHPSRRSSRGRYPRLSLVLTMGLVACTTNKTVAVGGGCSSDDVCATSSCLPATDLGGKPTGWSGGYCSGDCSTTSCPQGECQALADGKRYCLSACSSDGDCRSGYVCDQSLSVCLPDCRKSWSCGDTLTCSQSSGNCEPPSKTTQVGGACIYDVTCTTGTCFAATDSGGNATGWTGGYCSGDCSSCSQGKCQALEDGKSYCLASCSSNTACRSGYLCAPAISVCLPDCRNGWSCGSTLTCNQSTGNCG
jgi:hypothetical protein